MSIKKILSFTGIRSDYDLMSELYKKINNEENMEIALIVSGAHLSESYGYTYNHIKEDKIPVLATIENLIDSNSKSSRLKTLSILLQSCIHTIEKYCPDLIIYAGDREEVMVGALVGAYFNIPTAHFYGGDHATDGNVDNVIRHAASKLSTIHFVSNEISAKRLLKMGEVKNRVFNVGSPALDKFIEVPRIDKKELLKRMGKTDWETYAILIFHPILGEEDMAEVYFNEILTVLEEKEINTFISYPNTDSGNKGIINLIDKYKDNPLFSSYKNLPRNEFVNLLRNAKFLIGNSSAGLYEAPIIPLPVLNIGNRQKGRLAAKNVLFIEQGIDNIRHGIDVITSELFGKELINLESPFGSGNSTEMVINILKSLNINDYVKKTEDPLGGEFIE